MTKLTTEITIEELQYRIHAHENDLTQMWTADYFLNVQKELLALKQAAKNPVAWTDRDELEDANKGYSAYLFALDGEANKYADPRRKIMLYTAPPAKPVIPDEIIPDQNNSYEYVDGWNACRAEMLKAQPVSEPYKLPDVLDFDCEFENGDYDIDEEPWLRGRVDGFNEALQVIKRSLNTKQKPTAQESE